MPDEVVIADNDASGSAKPVVDAFEAAGAPYRMVYAIEPERGIASARNATVHRSSGQWLAFVDDDERAPAEWLERLTHAAQVHGADGVQGPVEPQVPETAASWLQRGRFFDWPHLVTGEIVPDDCLRFGNVLLAGEPVRALPGPFDPAFGLSTGEDGDMLMRLIAQGAKVIWCDEAWVFEPVEPDRLSSLAAATCIQWRSALRSARDHGSLRSSRSGACAAGGRALGSTARNCSGTGLLELAFGAPSFSGLVDQSLGQWWQDLGLFRCAVQRVRLTWRPSMLHRGPLSFLAPVVLLVAVWWRRWLYQAGPIPLV